MDLSKIMNEQTVMLGFKCHFYISAEAVSLENEWSRIKKQLVINAVKHAVKITLLL